MQSKSGWLPQDSPITITLVVISYQEGCYSSQGPQLVNEELVLSPTSKPRKGDSIRRNSINHLLVIKKNIVLE